MTQIQKLILVAGVLLLSLLMHVHYIDYGVSIDGHILPLARSDSSEAKKIRKNLQTLIRKKHWTDFSEMSGAQMQAELERIRSAGAIDKRLDSWMAAADSRRRQELKDVENMPIYFGMLASDNADKSHNTRRGAFWGGLIAPIVFVLALLFLILGRKVNQFPNHDEIGAPAISVNLPSKDEKFVIESKDDESLVGLLSNEFSVDFPVSSGCATEEDPLVIVAETDYVAIEYTVSRFMFNALKVDYKLKRQQIHSGNGRMVDELVFNVKPSGAEEWTGIRHLYFDITAGFNKLGA